MQKLVSMWLLFIFLSSACATSVAEVPATSTITLSFPPSLTPTITPIPSETPDPNIPEGATRKDSEGNYIKAVTENGKEVTYTWETISTGHSGETMTDWFTSHVENPTYKGGIPAIEQPANGYDPIISINFKVKEGIQAPFIQHTSNLESSSGLNFTRLLDTTLMERHYEKSIRKLSTDEMRQYYKDLYAGKISIPVTDENGDTYNLLINDNTRANIYLVNPEDITPDFHSAFLSSVTRYDNKDTLTILFRITEIDLQLTA